MGNHDQRDSRNRSDARAHRPRCLAFRLTSGRRRTKWAFRSAGRIGSAVEHTGHDQDDQRQNRRSSSSSLDHDLFGLELAAFALYIEAATVVRQPEQKASALQRAHLASELAASAGQADGDVKGWLEAFAQRVIERFDRILGTENAPPVPKFSRF